MALDVLSCPVTACFVLVLLFFWVRIFHALQDPKDYQLSYHDVIRRNQWWRLFSYSWCHVSFVHLIINVTSIWCCRHIELIHGSFFFLRYSFLIILVDGLLSLLVLRFFQNSITSYSDDQSAANIKLIGASGLTMAWISYSGVMSLIATSTTHDASYGVYYFFGIVPVSWYLAPLFMLTIAPVFLPRESMLSNGTGFACGYLLVFGILDIIPNFYWTVCLAINIYFILSLVNLDCPGNGDPDSRRSNNTSRWFLSDGQISDNDIVNVFQLSAISVSAANDGVVGERLPMESVDLEAGDRSHLVNNDDDDEVKVGDEDYFLGRRRPDFEESVPLLSDSNRWIERGGLGDNRAGLPRPGPGSSSLPRGLRSGVASEQSDSLIEISPMKVSTRSTDDSVNNSTSRDEITISGRQARRRNAGNSNPDGATE